MLFRFAECDSGIDMNNEYKNLIFWAWNKDMTAQEIDRQIYEMSEKGIGGFFIHSRAGLTIPYMEEEWFYAVQVSVQSAKKYGLDVWLYDEDGWPSGFAGGKVPVQGDRYRMKSLRFSETGAGINQRRIIARYRKCGANVYVLDKDGQDLIAYYVPDPHYVDLLDEDTTDKFIENTHEVYRQKFSQYFGNVIRGIFTDEPQLFRSEAWSFCLCDEFLREYGEQLLPQLWKLYTEKGQSTLRYKLGALRAKLFTRSYIRKISVWCEKNGLLLTGHLADEDGLCMSSKATGGTIANYKEMQLPGIDFLGKRLTSPVLLKQIQTAKNQFGKKDLLSETFGCCGWNTSFAEYAWIWAYQAAFGINNACLHIGAYSITGCRKRDYPAFFSYHEPWWNEFSVLNRWMYNVNRYLSEFEPSIDVLVISPLQNAFAYDCYADASRRISNQFRLLVESLIECQVGFDLGDELILEDSAHVENAQFVVGRGKYKKVIVPDADSLKESTWKLLCEFSRGGGDVVFTNGKPLLSEFAENAEKFCINGNVVMNRPDLWQKYFRDTGYSRLVKVSAVNERYAAKDIVVYSGKNKSQQSICFIVNTSTDSEKELLVRFSEAGTISEYDFETENKTPVFTEQSECGCYAKIKLPPKGVKCFVLDVYVSAADKNDMCYPADKVSERRLVPESIALTQPNCFTLDMARYSIDGGAYSDKTAVILLQDKIYKEINSLGKKTCVRILYEFEAADKCSDLTVWVERNSSLKLFINGQFLSQKKDKYWLDREIEGYDIASFVQIGNNQIVAEYLVEPYDVGFDPNQVFETEKNRFHYPVEFESIYIRGNFSLRFEGNKFKETTFYRLKSGNFIITKAKNPVSAGDLTCQDLWFYRGKVCYRYAVLKTEKRLKLRFVDVNAPVASIYINEKYAASIFNFSESFDLSDYLKDGVNSVCIELCSSNRNLLGPHHHMKGEVDFVGVNTFKGTKGYEDNILNPSLPENTYTDDYSFVSFGCKGVVLEEFVASSNK